MTANNDQPRKRGRPRITVNDRDELMRDIDALCDKHNIGRWTLKAFCNLARESK